MNDAKRAYAISSAEQPVTSRPSLEGTINVLIDKIEYTIKQSEELHSLLGSILYPLAPTPADPGANMKTSMQPVLPKSIERLESLCHKLDKLNDELSSIQSRLCL